MNLSQCIKQTQLQLEAANLHYGHGTNNSADEAVWLIQAAIDKISPDSAQVELDLQQEIDTAVLQQIEEYLQLRIEDRLPMAYITGETWFCGLPFYINSSVLIPRSPIAELIEEGFQPWVYLQAGDRVLDLCTGSGCIAAAIAVYMPELQVEAVDISAAALKVAARNIKRHKLQARVKLLQGDGFDCLNEQKYQLIITNPPYVSLAEYAQLPEEYLAEPQLGLTAGTDGMDLVVRILSQASEYLADNGVLICEVGASQPALEALFPEIPFLCLEFERGGEGVFVLSRQQLVASQALFALELSHRTGNNNGI